MEAAGEGYERDLEPEALYKEFLIRQKARLEDMRAMLLRMHASIEEEEKEWTESIHYGKPDNEDVAARILAGDLDTALDWRLTRRLGYIQRALEKIEEGTYGICDATGKQISRGRLEAVPEAIYTIAAQREREQRL
ncbi:MAG: TraR/DksA C4-type zinc finger protein [Rubrobacteraceae bacterium]